MTTQNRTLLSGSLIALVSLLSTGPVAAEPASLRATNGGSWDVDVTWWIFGPVSTTGTSTINGQSADIDMDLSEALDVLDFTSSLRLEAWRADFGLIFDASYLGLSDDGATTIGNGPLARGLTAKVEAEQSWVGLLAGYRFLQGQTAAGNRFSADLHGGARYNRIHQELRLTGSNPSGPNRSTTLGGTETWWEPVVGARGLIEINPNWTFAAGADFGGFGAGGNELTWSATAAFDWSFTENASLKFGYRYYSIDFETGSGSDTFGWDISQHGPFIGLTYAFN